MYPRLSDVFQDLFGIHLPIPIYSFGAMVALAILTAAWLAGKEMDRLYAEGRLPGVRVPAPADKKGGKRSRTSLTSPSALIWPMATLAAVMGIVGAKLFHILENLDAFLMDPAGMLFSSGGLTFYGGLIAAGLSIAYYLRKKGQPVAPHADSIAPGLMLAYGIGRIGCYLAGDGDWGVCSDLADKPGWIPAWLWSERFPNSIFDRNPADAIPFDAAAYMNCPPGADGVFPTMLYEFAMAAVLFAVLWALRKHPFRAGWLFSLYLVFNGIERFLIEQIRVNNTFDLLGLTVTQAEVIAVLSLLLGLAGLALTSKKRPATEPEAAATTAPAPGHP
ncbi:diacylglyceryl transferase [Rhodothermaceae bacterium RA]|nr:diacylglyceryl transferase [Rhodothermaceae bacterium RA]